MMRPLRHPDESPFTTLNREAHLAQWGLDVVLRPSDDVRVELLMSPDGFAPAPASESSTAEARAFVKTEDGAWLKVHSDRRPRAEAAQWLQQGLVSAAGRPDTLCVVGAGLGYVLETVFDQHPSLRVLALEPEPGLVPWLLARRDWRHAIQSGRLLILQGPDYEGATQAWRLFGARVAQPPVLVHPVLARARGAASRASGGALAQALHGARANEEARARLQGPYLENTLRNVPVIARATSAAALDGLAAHRPVVIAGAGPSLNRNLEQLRRFRERVILISVDTALKPILAAGIAPDFVVAIDPSALNGRHLADITIDARTSLVAECSISPSSFVPFGDRVFLFRIAHHAPWPWLTAQGLVPPTLRAWGSVVTSAFDLALRMQADPVVFIGTDLAYTNEQIHCRGTTFEVEWTQNISIDSAWRWVIERRAVSTTDMHGQTIRSAPQLLAFRDWLVEQSRGPGLPAIVNATGAGTLFGGGIQLATLEGAEGEALLGRYANAPRTQPLVRPRRAALSTAAHPYDAYLLKGHLDGFPEPQPVVTPADAVISPYRARLHADRVRETEALRASGGTDLTRWSDNDNLDPLWDRRAALAARFIPPGTRVLDLGAGRQSLRHVLPETCAYQAADVVERLPGTIVVDVNRDEFPEGAFDVVTTLGLLEYVHAPQALLSRIHQAAPLLVASYCVKTEAGLDARLSRGWVNDHSLSAFLELCGDAGWVVAAAERIDEAPGFDQWLFAMRRSSSDKPATAR